MTAVSEYSTIFIMLILLVHMTFSRPKRSKLFGVCYAGVIMAIITACVHVHIYQMINYAGGFYLRGFIFSTIVYYTCYLAILLTLFFFVNMLSVKRREQQKYTKLMLLVFALLYYGAIAYVMLNKKEYYFEAGVFHISDYYNVYMLFGILLCIMVFFATLANRNEIGNSVLISIFFFLPIEIAIIIFQLFKPENLFISISYMLPLLVFYIMFYSNPHDDLLGCQSVDSFLTRVGELLFLKQRYLIIGIKMPRVEKMDGVTVHEKMEEILTYGIRKIEGVDLGYSIYRFEQGKYALICRIKNEAPEAIIERAENCVNDTIDRFGIKAPEIKIVACENSKYHTHPSEVRYFLEHMLDETPTVRTAHVYRCRRIDYEDYYGMSEIQKELIDISTDQNLDDDRVLCYIQPIFEVGSNSFKSAEALIRMRLNGNTIYPDSFIPVAEKNNLVHVLTRIMINKVCKQIKALEQGGYDFDAISINVTAPEVASPNFHEEVSEIVEMNQVEYSKIRFEMTESNTFDDYDNLIKNMTILKDKGVKFYLDDFGTGYSNFERVISCPFNTIKFDKSLLYRAFEDKVSEELMDTLISLFKKQNFVVLVEGVENEAQSSFSIEKGFDYLQGYMYARPVPVEQITDYFQKRR